MNGAPFDGIEQFESDLWRIADDLRANSNLASNEYFMPIMGLLFLRYATSRYYAAEAAIKAEQAKGTIPKRPLVEADFQKRQALNLPEDARYDRLLALPKDTDLGKKVDEAMDTIEGAFPPLLGQLPKDYARFENDLVERMLRAFDSEVLRDAAGDVFGRIYEYFLAKFSMEKAHDNGEFFTPPSIVQLIVNVIEPDHGTVLDPACGSGGMFVQSSHFIEHEGLETMKRVTFYGHEKNETTARLAQMNLSVHGLEGRIRAGNEAITYFNDPHELVGACDFVMANPPFNVDEVDAEKVKSDPRLPFGLPGVNKAKKVSNGNYLWISYFWSYLNEHGRAGFVMSSQASGAGNTEADVRRKIVESGDVDVMIAVRSNFFYTRTVPCELWFFDRSKPEERKDTVLMLDARNVYRQVTRKIFDFSPEHLANLTAIVWLHRGQTERFLELVKDYLGSLCTECTAIPGALAPFQATLADLRGRFATHAKALDRAGSLEAEPKKAVISAARELDEAATLYEKDRTQLEANLRGFLAEYADALPDGNKPQHAARKAFDPLAEAIRGLVKQVDLLYKLAARAEDLGAEAAKQDAVATAYDRRAASRLAKSFEGQRKAAADQLKAAAYVHRQVAWLQDRFPKAELQPVPGLVKLVARKEIKAADWSLSPGRYVDPAPPEEDEGFDFEQTLHDIHVELADLNREAVELAAKIHTNFEELGA